MEVKELLKAAREKYEEAPSHVPLGESVPAGHNCAVSALFASDPTRTGELAMQAEQVLMEVIKGDHWVSIVDFNAEHTTGEVLAAFDRAIERVSA